MAARTSQSSYKSWFQYITWNTSLKFQSIWEKSRKDIEGTKTNENSRYKKYNLERNEKHELES